MKGDMQNLFERAVTITVEFMQEVRAAQEQDPLLDFFDGKIIGALAIASHYDDGACLAYLPHAWHRVSKQNWARLMVNSKTLTVVTAGAPFNPYQPQEVPPWLLIDLEPQWLGCHPLPLIDPHLYPRVAYPSSSLFLYPENWLVPAHQQMFIDQVCKREEIKEALVITKSPVILSDFHQNYIRIITR